LSGATISFAGALAQSQKMLCVGHVSLQPRSAPHDAAFVKRMGELGYREGANFAFDFLHVRSLDDYAAAYRELAARGCDILIASGNAPALSAAVGAAGNQIVVSGHFSTEAEARAHVADLKRMAPQDRD
jgi:putative tryptophan/tyrosine transport system substrate-binding protein